MTIIEIDILQNIFQVSSLNRNQPIQIILSKAVKIRRIANSLNFLSLQCTSGCWMDRTEQRVIQCKWIMNIIYTCLPSPTSRSLPNIILVTKDIYLCPYLLSAARQKVSRKRDSAFQAVASFSCPLIDEDWLASKFGVDGVTF